MCSAQFKINAQKNQEKIYFYNLLKILDFIKEKTKILFQMKVHKTD